MSAPNDVSNDPAAALADDGNWNLAARLEATAARLPAKIAFRSEDGEWSFRELDDRASVAAGGLDRLGVGAGDRVAVMAGSHLEFLATIFGAWKLGAIVVALNAQLGPEEVARQLNNAEPLVVVADEGRTFEVAGAAATGLGDRMRVVAMGTLDGRPLRAAHLRANADATIFYTSGTTGAAKGATHTHRALRVQLEMVARRYRITEADEMCSVLPIYLLSILVLGPLESVYLGATCRLMARYDPVVFARHVREERITVIGATIPMMFVDLHNLAPAEAAKVDLSSVRIASCGGSPMPPEVRRAFEARFNFRFMHAYGGTEGPATVSTDPLERDRKFESVGVPLEHISVTIEDDAGREMAPGTIGEICTAPRTDGPFAGWYEPVRTYWRMPAESDEALRGGRLRWGDLGYVDEDGYLYLVDRKKDMIIRGGMNVYPKELEALLYTDRRVAECAVVAAAHPRYGEVPWAFVRVAPGETLKDAEVHALVADHAARFKHLAGVTFVEDFPRNALGKILKRELRKDLPAVGG